MTEVLKALDAEIAEIETDIARNPDPRVAKIARLREIRHAYVAAQGSSRPAPEVSASAVARPTPLESLTAALAAAVTPRQGGLIVPRPYGRRPSPERQRAITAMKEFLADKAAPTRTTEIYEHLQSRGIAVGGTEPLNNLSAMLSNASEFQSHGRLGWTLQRVEEAIR
jgi:hypothetical protein